MIKIRFSILNDCKDILDIYQYYVLNSANTFEYEVPTVEEMENRMKHLTMKYPYLVADAGGKIVGYSYAGDFRYKAAYQWSPESTIYIHRDFHGQGIGKKGSIENYLKY